MADEDDEKLNFSCDIVDIGRAVVHVDTEGKIGHPAVSKGIPIHARGADEVCKEFAALQLNKFPAEIETDPEAVSFVSSLTSNYHGLPEHLYPPAEDSEQDQEQQGRSIRSQDTFDPLLPPIEEQTEAETLTTEQSKTGTVSNADIDANLEDLEARVLKGLAKATVSNPDPDANLKNLEARVHNVIPRKTAPNPDTRINLTDLEARVFNKAGVTRIETIFLTPGAVAWTGAQAAPEDDDPKASVQEEQHMERRTDVGVGVDGAIDTTLTTQCGMKRSLLSKGSANGRVVGVDGVESDEYMAMPATVPTMALVPVDVHVYQGVGIGVALAEAHGAESSSGATTTDEDGGELTAGSRELARTESGTNVTSLAEAQPVGPPQDLQIAENITAQNRAIREGGKAARTQRNRMWALLSALGFFTALVVVVTVSVLVSTQTKSNSRANNSPPGNAFEGDRVRTGLAIKGQLEQVLGKGFFEDLSSPQSNAMEWLVYEDPMLVNESSSNLLQRFLVVYFYKATTLKNDWRACNPPSFNTSTNATETDLCYYNALVGDGTFTVQYNPVTVSYDDTLATRWLTGAHECQWAGLFCNGEDQRISHLHLGTFKYLIRAVRLVPWRRTGLSHQVCA